MQNFRNFRLWRLIIVEIITFLIVSFIAAGFRIIFITLHDITICLTFNRIHDITVPSFLEGFNFRISSFLCFTVEALICLLLILEYSFHTM